MFKDAEKKITLSTIENVYFPNAHPNVLSGKQIKEDVEEEFYSTLNLHNKIYVTKIICWNLFKLIFYRIIIFLSILLKISSLIIFRSWVQQSLMILYSIVYSLILYSSMNLVQLLHKNPILNKVLCYKIQKIIPPF